MTGAGRVAGIALGLGAILGAADVLALGGARFGSIAVAARYAAEGGLFLAAAAALAGVCAMALAPRRFAPPGVGLAAAFLLPLALLALRIGQRRLDAPATSPSGLLLALAVAVPFALAALALGRRAERLLDPHASAAGLLLALACLAGAIPGRGEGNAEGNVILVSIDSVRADDWEAYVAADASPALRRFLDGSVRFSTARTTWSHSLPSHASMLTGLYPEHHGARVETDATAPGTPQVGTALSAGAPTLAETLAAAGFSTAGFTDNPWLGPPYGLERGFATHADGPAAGRLGLYAPWAGLSASAAGRYAQYAAARLLRGTHPTVRMALDWWDRHDGTRPAFVFVHFMENHVPHDPPADVRGRFARGPYADWNGRRTEKALLEDALSDAERTAARAHLHDLARASLSTVDRRMAPLLEGLEERGSLDRALVVLTSDHGDDFFERAGIYEHAEAWETVARVPLGLRLPGGAAAGRRDDPVSLVDIAPTVYAFAGIAPPAGLDGRDLLAAPAERAILVEGHDPRGPGVHRSVVRGSWSLVEDPAGRRTLYDLGADPLQERDLAASSPEAAARLGADLDAWVAGDRGGSGVSTEALPDEVRARLEALGYIGGE